MELTIKTTEHPKPKPDESKLGFGTIFILLYLIFIHGMGLPSIEGLLGAAYIGVFEMSLTYFLWLRGLKFSVNTAKVSNLVYISPFISLIIIERVLGEHILMSTILGLALIVAGILIQSVTRAGEK